MSCVGLGSQTRVCTCLHSVCKLVLYVAIQLTIIYIHSRFTNLIFRGVREVASLSVSLSRIPYTRYHSHAASHASYADTIGFVHGQGTYDDISLGHLWCGTSILP